MPVKAMAGPPPTRPKTVVEWFTSYSTPPVKLNGHSIHQAAGFVQIQSAMGFEAQVQLPLGCHIDRRTHGHVDSRPRLGRKVDRPN